MAGSSLEEGVQKHQKVYSFLKRMLPQDRYEGVRVIEPCVVVADGFKKSFQFAVLGDELLYITENPPRTSKDIRLKVDLAYVTSIELIHDVADFLGGDLKTKNQHVLLVYKKLSKQTSTRQSVAIPRSENSSSTRLALESSILSTSPVVSLETIERGGGKSPVLHPKAAMARIESQPATTRYLTVQMNRLHLSASDPDLRNLKDDHRQLYSGSTGDMEAKVSSSGSRRPLPPPPPGHESSVAQSNSKSRLRAASFDQERRRKKRSSSRPKRQNSSNEQNDLNWSSSSSELEFSHQQSSNSFHRQRSADFSNQYRAPSPHRDRYRSDSNGSMESDGELDNYSDEEINDSVPKRFELTELNLYILSENSPMFIYLRSTWNNCILKSTLRFGRRSSSPTSPTSSSKVDNSQLLHLFNQLKQEILQSHIMEKSFVLIQELLTAAEKSFNLKKYFWKSPDLFLFMVSQLQRYMPLSSSRSSRKKGSNREDELDYVVVLLQTFECLFRETDILSTRLTVIKANKGQAIKDLLKTIVIHPLTTAQKATTATISPAAQLLLSGADRGMFFVGAGEEETDKLLKEILDSAISLLFELICVVHQANCFSVEDNVLNIFWLMRIVEAQGQTKAFVERVMVRLTSLVSSSDKYLSPVDAVLLYRQLYVLKNFLEYGTVVANQIRVDYAEEFRYYIRKPVVKKKLSSEFPLTSPTIKLLEKVTDHVLNKTLTQQPSFR